MASNQELRRIYNLFTDCWRFYKQYADVKATSEFWEKVIAEGGNLTKKYGNDKFSNALVSTTIRELERKTKELKVEPQKA